MRKEFGDLNFPFLGCLFIISLLMETKKFSIETYFMRCRCGKVAELKCMRCGNYICKECYFGDDICIDCWKEIEEISSYGPH